MQAVDSTSPFASVIGLGPFQSEHRPSAARRVINLVIAGALLLSAPVVCAAGLWVGWDAYNHYGMNRALSSDTFLPLICAAGLLPLGAWLMFSTIRGWGTSVALYEGGFAYWDRRGLRQIKWADIDSVSQNIVKHYTYGVYTRTTYRYTIQLNDKSRIVLDNQFPKVEALGKAITNGSANALFPRYYGALKSGERLKFGPLALDGAGMYAGSKSLTWKEINAVKIVRGIISVKKEGGWFNWATVTVSQVPNFWVFVDLVSRFTKVE